MGYTDEAWEARAHGWRAVTALHAQVEKEAGGALQQQVGLSSVEYTLLDVLERQSGRHHLRMSQVARATALSESATTRLVDRLEARGLLTRYLCADDRRGIYTELTDTGQEVLLRARTVFRAALSDALDNARSVPELAPLVAAVEATLIQPQPDESNEET